MQATIAPGAIPSRSGSATRWRFLGREIASDFLGATLPAGRGGPPDITVMAFVGEFPDAPSIIRQGGGGQDGPAVTVCESDAGLQYIVDGVGRFWLNPDGRTVRYRLDPGAVPSDIDHFLAGPVLGLALQLHGQVMLHASAFMTGGQAVALSAPHGFGKSTLGCSFAKAGFPMLSDDILGVREEQGRWLAMHSVPRAKLWTDSLDALGEQPEGYLPALSWLTKRRLTIGQDWGAVAPDEVPLGVIYLLDPRLNDPGEPSVTPVRTTDAAVLLLANMYSPDTVRGARAAAALDAAARIVAHVPVRRLSYTRSFENLARIRAAVLEDVEKVTASRG